MMTLDQPVDRRQLIAAGATLVAAVSATASRASGGRAGSLSHRAFLDILGVNIHLNSGASPYADLARVTAAFDFLGVRSARAAAIGPQVANRDHYDALADRGIKFCMLFGGARPVEAAMDHVAAFETAHPGAVFALEGPNEIKAGFAHGGLLGTNAAQRFMSELRMAAAAHPQLRAKPLVAFTADTRVVSDCDAANVHFYPLHGAQPGPTFDQIMARWSGPAGMMPSKPVMVTEMGFQTLRDPSTRPGQWLGVDEEAQAILILNGWIAAAAAGITKLYLYELLDGAVDRSSAPNPENHFGLFRADGAPKTAAIAVGALNRLLTTPARLTSRAPGSPFVGRVDAGPSIRFLRIQGPERPTFLLFWNNSPIWDRELGAAATTRPVPVEVILDSPAPMTAWDIMTGRPSTDFNVSRAASLAVGARPVALQIG